MSSPANGLIRVSTSSHGVTVTLSIPGLAGWVVTRATLADALIALAANLRGVS